MGQTLSYGMIRWQVECCPEEVLNTPDANFLGSPESQVSNLPSISFQNSLRVCQQRPKLEDEFHALLKRKYSTEVTHLRAAVADASPSCISLLIRLRRDLEDNPPQSVYRTPDRGRV